jgi:hypothetical protein
MAMGKFWVGRLKNNVILIDKLVSFHYSYLTKYTPSLELFVSRISIIILSKWVLLRYLKISLLGSMCLL